MESCVLGPGALVLFGFVVSSAAFMSLRRLTAKHREKTDIAEVLCWLALMCAAVMLAAGALEIPKVLYRWRRDRCRYFPNRIDGDTTDAVFFQTENKWQPLTNLPEKQRFLKTSPP